MLDVICVGVATIDRIAVVDEIPADDTRVLVEPFTTAGGGPAATAAVALARLGARVGFCGVVGDDEAGRLVREQLEAEGVDTTWLSIDETVRTTESIVIVRRSTGTRTIVTTPSRGPLRASVPLDASRWVHVDQTGYAAVRSRIADAGTSRVPRLSIDAGNPIPGLDVSGVDLYAPTTAALSSSFPASSLSGSLVAARAAGAARIVATEGSSGSHYLGDGETVTIPAYPADPVSTMGAGDVFHGALLAGLVADGSLGDAVRLANVVASLSCRALDGRSGIPDLAEARAHLDSWA